eukprot:scaffold99798_cov27-Tisochrysis_lutea.AAC.2
MLYVGVRHHVHVGAACHFPLSVRALNLFCCGQARCLQSRENLHSWRLAHGCALAPRLCPQASCARVYALMRGGSQKACGNA